MPNIPLKNQIIYWLKDREYWLQSIGNRLLEGEALDKKLIEDAYLLFKEDNNLTNVNQERPDYPGAKILQDTKTIGNDNSNENQARCMQLSLIFKIVKKGIDLFTVHQLFKTSISSCLKYS